MKADRTPAHLIFYAALSFLLASAAAAAEPDVRAKRTWRPVAEFSPEEKALIDLRSETPRDSNIPYLPAEEYPFETPFTAEEMGYRIMNFAHNARWPFTAAETRGLITKAGYMTESVSVVRVAHTAEEAGVRGQMHATPGDAFLKFAFYTTYPPRTEHQQGLWVYRRTDKDQRTKIDAFYYFPSMRRVRRMPQPRRDESMQSNVRSLDDTLGRDAWEFSWRVIGTDILYETARFPATRRKITMARTDGSFHDVPVKDLKIMGDTYPFYTADGGVECVVLVAEPRKDWLPQYGLSKLIYWIDKHYFFPLRIEQYGSAGELKMVHVWLGKQQNAALGAEGYSFFLKVYWDLRRDLIGYHLRDAHRIVEWTEEEKAVMFSPDFMRRSWLKYEQQTHALVGSPKHFYLRPLLELGKFPEERPIRLAPDLEARTRAQDAAGHLVFADSGGAQAGDE